MPHPVIEQINSVLERFLSLRFTALEAKRLFAKAEKESATPEMTTKPDRIELTYSDFEFSKDFLTSIDFSWQSPQTISMVDLESSFGRPKTIPALQPVSPTTWHYVIGKYPLWGQVQVEGFRANDGTAISARDISLRRLAPEPYCFKDGTAIRLVVFADLFSSDVNQKEEIRSVRISRLAGIDEAIGYLVPEIAFELQNFANPEGEPLRVTLKPISIRDFTNEGMLRLAAPFAELLHLRENTFDLRNGDLDREGFHRFTTPESFPPEVETLVEELLSSPSPEFDSLIHAIDRILSVQMETMLSHPKVRRFREGWLGLQYLASHLNVEDGSQVEIYSTSLEDLEHTFKNGFFEQEYHHRSGHPPILAILDYLFAGEEKQKELLERLSEMAGRINSQIAFGIKDAGASAWDAAAGNKEFAMALACAPRFLLFPGIEKIGPSGFPLETSENFPHKTGVYGNGAWLIASAIAAAQARDGRLITIFKGAEHPEAIFGTPAGKSDVRHPEDIRGLEAWGDASPFTLFKLSESGDAMIPALLRYLHQEKRTRDRPPVRILFSPLLQTIDRIFYLHAAETSLSKIQKDLYRALKARMPKATARVEMTEKDDFAVLWDITVETQFAINGKRLLFQHSRTFNLDISEDSRWPE